ncbi:hypothetical protein Goshw_022901 [Gossypium schwendimanii]|uniref:Uncharacterized protein n=1 Tax=Gossypium schwendimanii TaxID=34291 RepID=A0A7J9MUV6_GOSSC|nr:hypothetical protein [Gossypium schwendimanii]
MEGKDIAEVIKEALAQTLVFYYSFAGRLKEGAHGKLIVDNGEGVMFIKADADVTLQPPFPCFEELLFDVPGSQAMPNCPLLLVQVTQLKCGGFIFALRFNHVMCDGTGLQQFMSAIGEMARGVVTPSIPPVWERHLLNARDPPRVTFTHHEYDRVEATVIMDNMVKCSFFFGTVEVSLLRSLLPLHTFAIAPNLFAIRGKSLHVPAVIGSNGISDLMHMGFENVDFGRWGKAVFGGRAKATGLVSFFIPTKNKEGQVGTLVPICLPASAMERFSNELDNMLKHQHIEGKKSKSILISSAM